MQPQKISPCLWFDRHGEEAANFYLSVFPNSRIKSVSRYGEGMPLPKGTALMVSMELNGQEFLALNGGPHFKISPAISFMVYCADQKEIDYYWERLSAVREAEQCGWVCDKFGVSWQIVPTVLSQLMDPSDPARAGRVMAALMKMKKLDIAQLQQAAKAS